MREQAPVAWFDFPDNRADLKGFWALTDYADIKEAELLPEIFSSQRGTIFITTGPKEQRENRLSRAAVNNLICLDREFHMPLRMHQRPFFTKEFARKLREKVACHVDGLLDALEKRGPVVDIVPHFSEQIPLFTLCEILGVDEKDRPKIIHWMHYLEMAQDYFVRQHDGRANLFLFSSFYFMSGKCFGMARKYWLTG